VLERTRKVILVARARRATGATIEANAAEGGAKTNRLRPARAERKASYYVSFNNRRGRQASRVTASSLCTEGERHVRKEARGR